MFLRLQAEARALIKNLIEIAYFMRGAMTYESVLLSMSYTERQIVADFLKERLEQESKSPHPNY